MIIKNVLIIFPKVKIPIGMVDTADLEGLVKFSAETCEEGHCGVLQAVCVIKLLYLISGTDHMII